MRIACVSDIHGNLPALEAVLDDIDRLGVAEFTEDERQQLRDLPPTVSLPEAPDVLFYHAGPANDMDVLRPFSSDDEMQSLFGERNETFFVAGHDHTQRLRHWQGRTMCICGSVGLTVEGNGARYLILERRQAGWEPQHRSVDYDVKRVLQRFVETDYIGRTGPMGRLFVRHVATGTEQVVPFVRWYRAHGEIEFADAVERFLNLN